MDDLRQETTIKKGVMKMLSDRPFWWVAPSVFFGVIAFAAAVAVSSATGMRLLGYLAILIIGLPAEIMFLIARTGKRCEYTADGEKLTLRRANKPEECYYYAETRNVEIAPFHMLWLNCGYRVKIETKYQTVTRYFAFDGPNDRTRPQDTPFAILGERIPQRAADNGKNFANYTGKRP